MLPAEKLNVLEFWPGTVKNFPIALSELAFSFSEPPVNDAFVDGILFCWSSATRNGWMVNVFNEISSDVIYILFIEFTLQFSLIVSQKNRNHNFITYTYSNFNGL